MAPAEKMPKQVRHDVILNSFQDLLHSLRSKWEDTHIPGAFNGDSQFSLMLRTVAGHAAGDDFSALINVVSQLLLIFIIKIVVLVLTELTNLDFSSSIVQHYSFSFS